MGIIDRFVDGYLKRKGLNPYPVTQPKIQGVNSAILQQYGADSYVSEGYLSNSDVYAIVSFLARKAASIPWYVYQMKPGEKAQTALNQYKQLSKGLQNKGAYEMALIKRKSAYEENIVTGSPLEIGRAHV